MRGTREDRLLLLGYTKPRDIANPRAALLSRRALPSSSTTFLLSLTHTKRSSLACQHARLGWSRTSPLTAGDGVHRLRPNGEPCCNGLHIGTNSTHHQSCSHAQLLRLSKLRSGWMSPYGRLHIQALVGPRSDQCGCRRHCLTTDIDRAATLAQLA
jgi:hypothetical protein